MKMDLDTTIANLTSAKTEEITRLTDAHLKSSSESQCRTEKSILRARHEREELILRSKFELQEIVVRSQFSREKLIIQSRYELDTSMPHSEEKKKTTF